VSDARGRFRWYTGTVRGDVRFAARILAIIALIGFEAVLWTPVRLEIGGWVSLYLTLLLGSVPFGLLGIALGYWAHPRAANAVANLLWIVLTYAGGVWGEPIQPVEASLASDRVCPSFRSVL